MEEWAHTDDCGVIFRIGDAGGGAYLEIYEGETDTPDAYLGAGLQFRVADVDAFTAGLKGKWPCEGPKDRPWGARYLYLRDPNGVAIVVYDSGF